MLGLNLGELFGAEGEGGSMPAARIFPPPPPPVPPCLPLSPPVGSLLNYSQVSSQERIKGNLSPASVEFLFHQVIF